MINALAKPTKKPSLAKLKKLAWDDFSIFIRLRDSVATTGTLDELICVTCLHRTPSFGQGGAQAGHFIPGRGNAYLFDEVQVNGQCMRCNVFDHGNWPNYYFAMTERHGRDAVDEMLARRHDVRKYSQGELIEMRADFKARADKIRQDYA